MDKMAHDSDSFCPFGASKYDFETNPEFILKCNIGSSHVVDLLLLLTHFSQILAISSLNLLNVLTFIMILSNFLDLSCTIEQKLQNCEEMLWNIEDFMPKILTFKTFLRNLVPRFPIFFGLCFYTVWVQILNTISLEVVIVFSEQLVKCRVWPPD